MATRAASSRTFRRGPPPNPYNPANATKDSDCDGLSDEEEFSIVFAGGKKTDPTKGDTDGDGILDGVEAGKTASPDPSCPGFVGDADPASRTSPTEVDSDADGLPEGVEDANHNGKLDSGETNPVEPGLGRRRPARRDRGRKPRRQARPRRDRPALKDTDGDKINDGVEQNVTKTDPLKTDTDGDGCPDGAEDFNQNGKLDPGETNPLDAADCGTGGAGKDSDGDGLPDTIEDGNGNGVEPQSARPTGRTPTPTATA